ncbi:Phox domain-containing family protein [Striga asiatica]|uniref:Phox domain-containing family protein n=1 Tax=Striga asiatica TaxID=4170 RepID=A0A5A7RI32_STRAF|nr:Phox domain-containing family protein [Striga asiatica]
MIKGEPAEEKPPPPSWDRESDGGDDLSHYSSCGGESEFDRYCSASSAMGTPSFRGSSYGDPDFGPLRGFRLGEENANTQREADRVLSSCGESNLNGKMEGFDVGGRWGNGVLIGNENETIGGASVQNSDDFPVVGDVNNSDEIKNSSDEGEISSRYEHSEGEDSMFGCGSDGENKIGPYYNKKAPLFDGESERRENRLVMNSAVAFGSDDWDDFVNENRESTIGSMGLDKIRTEKEANIRSGIGSLGFMTDNRVTHRDTVKRRKSEADCTSETDVNAPFTKSTNLMKFGVRSEDAERVVALSNEANDMDELADYLGPTSGYSLFERNEDPVGNEVSQKEKLKIGESETKVNIGESECKVKIEDRTTVEIMHRCDIVSNNKSSEVKNKELASLSESEANHHHLIRANDNEPDHFADTSRSAVAEKNYSFAFDQADDHFVPDKKMNFELNDFYDEIVNEMEDILLDSGEPSRSRFTHSATIYQSHFSHPSRDGGSTASTSGTDYAHNFIHQPPKIDKIEVVGTSQRKGDVSFSERLVGVQKYTVYKVRVWSGEDHWEIERRYREFSTLYHRLKKLFDGHGWTLPSPWSHVEKESRKLFGNASPNVVADRSVLIQECLQSVIHPKFNSISHNALISFLSLSEAEPGSPHTNICNRSMHVEGLGKTISLVVEKRPLKSIKQMLDAQHYRCAGCHRNFDDGRTTVLQALGWGKPRLCEYSGQLFCPSCHNNDTAVLPARVLHHWDFTRYPVSQMAKSFLDSINDQPMLCVSAVNPFLFTKVPTLQHVANIRSRIRAMLPYVRCPFRRSIHKGLGPRSYLLDSNDFFALKDLTSLSNGVFSALPVMVETVSRKIQEHITEQCLVCYDAGIPCSARKDCNNPLSLIFPFQDEEVEKCKSCELVFHKNCFDKLAFCSCGARFKHEHTKQGSSNSLNSNLNLIEKRTAENSTTGLLADLFSKVMPGKSQIPRKQETRRVDNVILMGSIPNNSL